MQSQEEDTTGLGKGLLILEAVTRVGWAQDVGRKGATIEQGCRY